MSWGSLFKRSLYYYCVRTIITGLDLASKKRNCDPGNYTPVLKPKHFFVPIPLVIDGISVSLSDNCSKARKKPLTLLMKNALNYTHRALVL